jgi:hypothetical protein
MLGGVRGAPVGKLLTGHLLDFLSFFLAIKHQLKVGKAFACSDFATAICTITVQLSLGSTSLSDVCAALQAGPSLKISTGYFLYALSSCGYGFILDITQERASGFHVPQH